MPLEAPGPTPPEVRGQHWTLDFSGCACLPELLATRQQLEDLCASACREVGLSIVGSLFHQFDPVGVTGVVLLAESHLSVHTWPDQRFVALDVYVCNHLNDNTAKGEALVKRMRQLFLPTHSDCKQLSRRSIGALRFSSPRMNSLTPPPAAERLKDIEPFHVVELLTRARQLEAEGRDIIHMEVGEPDFPTPPPIADAAIAAIRAGQTLYTPALGLPELRTAISDFYRTRYGVEVPASRIAVTAGASGALNLAFACLANPGSEWLLADPGYPCNRHILRTYEGRPCALPVGPESNFQPTPEQVAAAWNERTAGLLVASPANPTGTLLSLAQIKTLADSIRQRRGHFLVDEIYHGLTYPEAADGGETPTACAAGDDIWVINSFSKYFQMTGWRLGWMVIPEAYVRAVEKLAQNLTLCPPTVAQHAALAAFTPETIALLEARRAEFRARRDFLAPALEALGLRVIARPEGAFYLYCDCSALATDSFALARDLLEKTGVAATPGLDFGSNQPERHIRFAYTTSIPRLTEAVERLRGYFGR